MALIGYARVSTVDQNSEAQVDRLKAAGCVRVYVDHGASGAKASRPEWDKCLDRLDRGDTLMAVKLDRFGRSIHHLMDLSRDFNARGINLRCLDQPIDTSTPEGRLFYGMLALFAEFERDLIVTRTREGLAATAARGRSGGRKHLLTDAQAAALRSMRDATDADGKRLHSIPDLQAAFPVNGRPVSRQTVYRALGMMDEEKGSAAMKQLVLRRPAIGDVLVMTDEEIGPLYAHVTVLAVRRGGEELTVRDQDGTEKVATRAPDGFWTRAH